MEEKERFEYYPKQNQLYDKINDELYCLGIKQDKTRLVDFLNLMNEDWWTLYERNKELREENQQLKQQLAEKDVEIEKLNACVKFYKSYYISFKEKVIDELEQVKEKLLEELQNVTDLLDPLEYEDYHELIGCGRGYKNSIEYIDNQIEELTHQHEGKGEPKV